MTSVQLSLNFVCKRRIIYREELVIAELIEIINVFHDLSATLCTVTSIHKKAGFVQMSINIFRSVNLTLFTLTTKNVEQPETRKRDGIGQKIYG